MVLSHSSPRKLITDFCTREWGVVVKNTKKKTYGSVNGVEKSLSPLLASRGGFLAIAQEK